MLANLNKVRCKRPQRRLVINISCKILDTKNWYNIKANVIHGLNPIQIEYIFILYFIWFYNATCADFNINTWILRIIMRTRFPYPKITCKRNQINFVKYFSIPLNSHGEKGFSVSVFKLKFLHFANTSTNKLYHFPSAIVKAKKIKINLISTWPRKKMFNRICISFSSQWSKKKTKRCSSK